MTEARWPSCSSSSTSSVARAARMASAFSLKVEVWMIAFFTEV